MIATKFATTSISSSPVDPLLTKSASLLSLAIPLEGNPTPRVSSGLPTLMRSSSNSGSLSEVSDFLTVVRFFLKNSELGNNVHIKNTQAHSVSVLTLQQQIKKLLKPLFSAEIKAEIKITLFDERFPIGENLSEGDLQSLAGILSQSDKLIPEIMAEASNILSSATYLRHIDGYEAAKLICLTWADSSLLNSAECIETNYSIALKADMKKLLKKLPDDFLQNFAVHAQRPFGDKPLTVTSLSERLTLLTQANNQKNHQLKQLIHEVVQQEQAPSQRRSRSRSSYDFSTPVEAPVENDAHRWIKDVIAKVRQYKKLPNFFNDGVPECIEYFDVLNCTDIDKAKLSAVLAIYVLYQDACKHASSTTTAVITTRDSDSISQVRRSSTSSYGLRRLFDSISNLAAAAINGVRRLSSFLLLRSISAEEEPAVAISPPPPSLLTKPTLNSENDWFSVLPRERSSQETIAFQSASVMSNAKFCDISDGPQSGVFFGKGWQGAYLFSGNIAVMRGEDRVVYSAEQLKDGQATYAKIERILEDGFTEAQEGIFTLQSNYQYALTEGRRTISKINEDFQEEINSIETGLFGFIDGKSFLCEGLKENVSDDEIEDGHWMQHIGFDGVKIDSSGNKVEQKFYPDSGGNSVAGSYENGIYTSSEGHRLHLKTKELELHSVQLASAKLSVNTWYYNNDFNPGDKKSGKLAKLTPRIKSEPPDGNGGWKRLKNGDSQHIDGSIYYAQTGKIQSPSSSFGC